MDRWWSLSALTLLNNIALLRSEQLTWWAPLPKNNNSNMAICLTGTKRTLHATFSDLRRILLDHLARHRAQADIFVIMQVDSDSTSSGRHKNDTDVVDYMSIADELSYLREHVPRLTYADLFDSNNASTPCACEVHPVSLHRCCNTKLNPNFLREAVFGPWLSYFRAQECFEQVKRRELQRLELYDSVLRLRPDLSICNGTLARQWLDEKVSKGTVKFYHDYAWMMNRDSAPAFYEGIIESVLAACGDKHPDTSMFNKIVHFKKAGFSAPRDENGSFFFKDNPLKARVETNPRGKHSGGMRVVRSSKELRRHFAMCNSTGKGAKIDHDTSRFH